MFRDLSDGITSYVQAWHMISQYRLWKYFIVPGMLATGLVYLLYFGLIKWLAPATGGFIVSKLQWIPWHPAVVFLNKHAWAVGMGVIIVFGIVVFKYLLMIIISPFMSLLSERIENIVRQGKDSVQEPFKLKTAAYQMFRGLSISIGNLLKESFFIIVLGLLGLFPLFGLIVPLVILLVQAHYAGFGNLDFTLERHFNVKRSRSFMRDYRGLAIGNGIPYMLILFIPFIGLFLAPPLAAAAGTLEILRRLD